MLNHTPLRTLFRQDHEGRFTLKPATSSPPDIDTRESVALEPPEFDPDQPVTPAPESTDALLRDIRNLLRDMQPNPPADNFRPVAITLADTTGGESVLDINGGFNYVYLPPVPRAVTVYWGNTAWALAVMSPGQAAKLHIPYRMDQFRLTWGAGTINQVIYALFTTDPIEIDILAY